MRIGKRPTKSSYWTKAGLQGKPKHISPEVVVGQLSPDIVSTCFVPKIQRIATDVLERYADEVLLYEDTLRELGRSSRDEKHNASMDGGSSDGEVDVEFDGTVEVPGADVNDDAPFIKPPRQPLFHSQHAIEEFSGILKETSNYFFSKEGGWKTQANSAKFERLMDEKYGVFRPFIKDHPQVEESIRSIQRKYATGYFSPFRQSDPPIPKSTAVVILFMMQRGKVRWEIILLTGVFLLVGLQPWALILIVGTIQGLLSLRKNRPVGKMKRRIPAVDSYYEGCETAEEKHKMLKQPVGKPETDDINETVTEYDTILVGSGAATLYTGALLARAGRKILLLSPDYDVSGCVTMSDHKKLPAQYKDLPFDIQYSNVSKLSQQLNFLAPALSTRTDFQGGVRFAKIGTDADNHTFEILEIPGIGAGGGTYRTLLTAENTKELLMDEAATNLGDGWPGPDGSVGNSVIGTYMNACEQINATSSLFYASKIIPDSVNNTRSKSSYGECATRYAAGLLNQSFPLNAQTRSLVAAIGMRVENIRPNNTSLAAHVTHLCSAISGEGMYYPVGGPRALCHALANIIERNGGRVVAGAPAKELIFLDEPNATVSVQKTSENNAAREGSNGNEEDTTPCPRCVGVKLQDGRVFRFADDLVKRSRDPTLPAVISMTGLIDTFIRLLPDDIRTNHKVPRGLPALSERRPLLKALFLLDGTAQDLQLTGADYYRLPNAAKAIDEVNQQTGHVTYGEIGWSNETTPPGESSEEDIAETTNNTQEELFPNASGASDDSRKRRQRVFKFENGLSWMNISFPSAKDPSFQERHGKVTTCVVTIEADDDFVKCFDSKPKLYIPKQSIHTQKSTVERLLDKIKRDLFDLYPQLEGKVIHSEISNFLVRALMHNPERYAAKGVRVDTPYPGLFLGGSDLTVSGSFSASIVGGWLAANAVAGYNYIDFLFLGKNITSDIAQFLEPPGVEDEEDVAVPFTPAVVDEVKESN
ncbi:hypothetical protein ACA910_005265 [Epithemia clementina (nom. ined.)]